MSNSSAPPVRLRGHHLLCIFGFRGAGYDRAHAEGMAAVVRRLRAPEARVEIAAGLDDICAACPHRAKPRCASPEMARDGAVLAALHLRVGETLAAATLPERVARRVAPAEQALLCAGCGWLDWGVCAAGLAAGRVAAGWEDAVHRRGEVVEDGE